MSTEQQKRMDLLEARMESLEIVMGQLLVAMQSMDAALQESRGEEPRLVLPNG